MHKLKLEHKILSITFLLFFFALIFFHIKYNVGLFFDQPAMFITGIQGLDENLNGYFYLHDDRIRFFTNFLVSVPFNIELNIYQLFTDKISILKVVSLFSSSYYIIHLFALLINFLVSLRTKRYDIAVISFAFYCIFCMPNMIWAVREIHITILMYFALLSYFLSKQKLSKIDILPVTLLTVYMFESFEVTIIYGFLLNIFACLYTVYKKDENLGFKNYIGTICLFVSIYIICKMFIWIGDAVQGGFTEYFNAFSYYYNTMSRSITLLLLFIIPIVIICCFYKRQFGIKSILSLIMYFIVVALFIVKKTQLVHDAADELSFYSGAMILIFPIVLTILLIDYLEIKLDNKAFCSNLFIVACIIGIVQLLWQIHGCFVFGQYVDYLKNLMNTSDEKLIQIPQEDYDNNMFLRLYLGFGIIHQSVLLNPTNPVEKIIVPSPCRLEDTKWHNVAKTHQENGGYVLNTAFFSDKHRKYIDVSEITKYIEEQEEQNKLKDYMQ